MRKSLIFTVVVLAVLGLLFVLSMDDDPLNDTHLVFTEGAMPTEGNGFLVLLESLEAMEWPEDDAWVHATPRQEIPKNDDILALVERNRDALALVAAAAAAPLFQVPSTDLEVPAFMAETRQLGHLVAIDATIRMLRGDEEAAFDRLFQYLALVHRFESTGELIHYLIGSAYQATTMQHILRIAADTDGEGLELLANRVEDYAWARETMENALRREYVFMTTMVDEPFSQDDGWKDVPLLRRYIYQPNRTRKLYADSFAAAIEGLNEDCSTAPRESEQVTIPKWRYLAPNSVGGILHNISVSGLERFTFSRCRQQMTTGLTQLALATRAYRADVGELPEDLDALVPNYLGELPVDVDGQAFRYSPSGEYLYSVGEDRLDDGGGEPTFRVDWSAPDPGVSLRRE